MWANTVYYESMKWVLDRVVSLLLILLCLPLAVPILIVVMVESGNPLFVQRRVGKMGRLFPMLKFRSMPNDLKRHQAFQEMTQSTEWQLYQKLEEDPRISVIGRFIRKYSLDELPQLLNVLVGQMSLVGPRPITPDQIEMYGEGYSTYCEVLPGMTGLWQVSGRNNLPFSERVALDLEYAQQRSLSFDLRIMIKTVGAVISGDGAS